MSVVIATTTAFEMKKSATTTAGVNSPSSSPSPLARPKVASTISFSRFESSSCPPPPSIDTARSRASTTSGASPVVPQTALSPALGQQDAQGNDVFVAPEVDVTSPTLKGSQESFDELPIEIRSLTERFLKELTAPVHAQPVTVDNLSDLFQDFYTKAESHIAAHIATLSLKIGREKSPVPSINATRPSNTANKNGTATPTRKASGEQQMLTVSEVTDRRKARRLLELKKTAWEETVERTVVERVYTRIYRHRSADDEERDQKLRSRIAALSLVGIGLKELLAGATEIPEDVRSKSVQEQDTIRDMLAGARKNIQDMDLERHPLGKLQHLTAAHKSIVETLSQLFPSSSSADEILPTLIYALITSEPADVNVVSNLKFIQRFRSASKVDGEAAYCLVNLEAATAFLETVDLASLRASESTSAGTRDSNLSLPRAQTSPMNLGVEPASDPATSGASSPGAKLSPSPTSKQSRRLSNLISNGTNRLNEASDSLRGAMLEGADSAFDTINNTLNSSFNLLFGRLREHQVQSGNEAVSQDVLPKTLEDARKLVSTPPPEEEVDSASIGTGSSLQEGDDQLPKASGNNERVTELFGGKRQIRDRSADSQRSASSGGKRVAFDSATSSTTSTAPNATVAAQTAAGLAPAPANAAIEGMRNFGNTINPLNQLSRMGGLFGRSGGVATTTPTVATSASSITEKPLLSPGLPNNRSRSSSDAKASAAVNELKKMAPPSKKFIECKDAKELKVGDVEELLKEYQRLVTAMGKVIASV